MPFLSYIVIKVFFMNTFSCFDEILFNAGTYLKKKKFIKFLTVENLPLHVEIILKPNIFRFNPKSLSKIFSFT